MTSHSQPVDIEAALASTAWIRTLARSLARSGAEDLVQETWLASLTAKGGSPGDLRKWLGGVVRNLARRERRASDARSAREREVARGEALPGADELVAEAELQRRAIAAVMELEEPYRSTVLLRFFRGLTAEEIAGARGVPSATVRTQLKRALDRLRVRFDREYGERGTWCAVALAIGGGHALGGGALGQGLVEVLSMGTKAKLAVAAALAAATATVAWRVTNERGAESENGSASAQLQAIAPSALPGTTDGARLVSGARASEAEGRSPVAADGSGMERLFDEVLLFGSVRDPNGAALSPSIWLEDGTGTTSQASIGAPGTWSRTALRPGPWVLRALGDRLIDLVQEIEIRGDEPQQRLDLVLEPGLAIKIKLVDEKGELLDPKPPQPSNGNVSVLATIDPLPAGLGGASVAEIQWWGAGRFEAPTNATPVVGLPSGYSGLLVLRRELPVYVSVVLGDVVLQTTCVRAPVDELVLRVERASVEAAYGSVTARLVDAVTGAPLAGNVVELEGTMARADQDGFIRIEHLPPGPTKLSIFLVRGYETVFRNERVTAGRVNDLGTIELTPAATIRGRILDASGAPVNASLLWRAARDLRSPLDSTADYSTSTLAEGAFEIPFAGRREGFVIVLSRAHAIAVRRVDASAGLVEGIEIRLQEGTNVSLHNDLDDGLVRQVTIATSEGVPILTHAIPREHTRSVRLAPGTYELWIGAAERVEEERQLVVAREPLVLSLREDTAHR